MRVPQPRRGRAGWLLAAAALLLLALSAVWLLSRGGGSSEDQVAVVSEEQPAESPPVPASAPMVDTVPTEPAGPADANPGSPTSIEPAAVVEEEAAEAPTTRAPAPSTPVQAKPAPPPVQSATRPAPTPTVKPREDRPIKPNREDRGDDKVAVEVEARPERQEREPKSAPRETQKEEDEEEISFVDPPRPVSVPPAAYPEGAAGSGAKGKIVVSILVSAGGEVIEVGIKSILIEGGDRAGLTPLFREAALAAARKARFEPALSDGRPVSYRGELTYTF